LHFQKFLYFPRNATRINVPNVFQSHAVVANLTCEMCGSGGLLGANRVALDALAPDVRSYPDIDPSGELLERLKSANRYLNAPQRSTDRVRQRGTDD
jgi:hypothetical protein